MDRLIVVRNIGMALFAAVLFAVAWVSESKGERTSVKAQAADPLEIILQLNHENVGVNDVGTWIPIYLTNIFQDVSGFEVSLLLDRPDLFKFRSDSVVETTIVCIDTLDCDPADTTIDTVQVTTVDTAGSSLAGWEFVKGRALSDFNWKLAAIAGDSLLNLPPTGTPRLLARVYIESIASQDLLDTLTDRTTLIYIISSLTSFADPNGNTIGREVDYDTLNPPRYDTTITCDTTFPGPVITCDTTEIITTVDTTFYTDSTQFLFVDGSRTFSGSCVSGDVDESGSITSADIIYLVNYVFKGGAEPTCSALSGDVNCSGTVNSADIIYLVGYVFKGGVPPAIC